MMMAIYLCSMILSFLIVACCIGYEGMYYLWHSLHCIFTVQHLWREREKKKSLFWSMVCIKDNKFISTHPWKNKRKDCVKRQATSLHPWTSILCLWNIYKHLFTTLQYVLFTRFYLSFFFFFFHWLGILLLYCPRRITTDFMSREN